MQRGRMQNQHLHQRYLLRLAGYQCSAVSKPGVQRQGRAWRTLGAPVLIHHLLLQLGQRRRGLGLQRWGETGAVGPATGWTSSAAATRRSPVVGVSQREGQAYELPPPLMTMMKMLLQAAALQPCSTCRLYPHHDRRRLIAAPSPAHLQCAWCC